MYLKRDDTPATEQELRDMWRDQPSEGRWFPRGAAPDRDEPIDQTERN